MTRHHNGIDKNRVPTIFSTNCFHVSTPLVCTTFLVTAVTFIQWRNKPKQEREVKKTCQGDRARKWERQNLNAGSQPQNP